MIVKESSQPEFHQGILVFVVLAVHVVFNATGPAALVVILHWPQGSNIMTI